MRSYADNIYNTERPHQALPGRITPLAAWEATPKVDPPHPRPDRPVYRPPAAVRRPRPTPPPGLPAGTRLRTVSSSGDIGVDLVVYKVGGPHKGMQVLVVSDGDQPGDKIIVTDLDGEILAEHTRPAPGVRYVGNGRPPGRHPKNPRPSPKS